MIHALAKIFIKNSERTDDSAVRRAWGALCGAAGVALNLLLTAAKLLAGALSGSIAITADALNNLSDALSSLIALIGFRLSAKKPDRDHPYGHRRYEYIAGLIVSLAILLMGANLARSCVGRIFHPEPVHFAWLPVCILAASIALKLYMAYYNHRVGRAIQSPTLAAAAADSLSDALATGAVLAATALSRLTDWNVDAWAGAAVSLLILLAGVQALRKTVSPLLGSAPDEGFVRRVQEIVNSCPEVLGMHDLMVHDYGAGRTVISLHAEVRADGELMALHDAIDRLERRLQDELNCSATIHMDPVSADTETSALRERVEADVRASLGASVTLHDFRREPGMLSFDAALPYELALSDEEALSELRRIAQAHCPDCKAEITVDRK